jgi:hypothetical protein
MFASRLCPSDAYSNVQGETSGQAADYHQPITLLLDGALSARHAVQVQQSAGARARRMASAIRPQRIAA